MSNKSNKLIQLPPEETAVFCDQVAQMLHGGILLEDGAETLRSVYAQTKYADAFNMFADKVHETGEMTGALRESGIFPAYLVQMSEIGEKSGTLEESMESAADYYRQEAEVRQDLKNAIRYPLALLLAMMVLLVVMLTLVFPIFRNIINELPKSDVSNSAVSFGTTAGIVILVIALLMTVAMVVFAFLLKSKYKQQAEDAVCRVFPPLRDVLRSLSATRFATVTGRLLEGGYPTEEALELAQTVAAEEATKKKLARCSEVMNEGKSFSEATKAADIFSPLYQQMVQVGESCGQLDRTLLSLADTMRAQTNEKIDRLTGLIEPILVALLAVILGALLLSVMLPLIGVLLAL